MANIYNMLDSWTDSGTVYTAIKMNVTDTASAAASLLMDLQVGSISKLKLSKAGQLSVFSSTLEPILRLGNDSSDDWYQGVGQGSQISLGYYFISKGTPTTSNYEIILDGNGSVMARTGYYGNNYRNSDGALILGWGASSGNNGTTHVGRLSFGSSLTNHISMWMGDGSSTFSILRHSDATTLISFSSNVWEQYNSTTAQSWYLYNTRTNSSNYERAVINWSSNVLQIGTGKAGTGSSRNISFLYGGLAAATIDSTGLILSSPFPILGWSDANIRRAGANSLEIRNGTSPQSLTLYGTYTDLNTYERLIIAAQTGDDCIIAFHAGLFGGTQRSIAYTAASHKFYTGNSLSAELQWTLSSSGLIPETNNSDDLGSSTKRVKTGYFTTANISSSVTFSTSASIISAISSGDIYIGGTGGSGWHFMSVDSGQHLIPVTNNARNLGGTSNRVATGYFGTKIQIGSYSAPSSAPLEIQVDGTGTGFTISNSSTEYTRFVSGGVQKGMIGFGTVPFGISNPGNIWFRDGGVSAGWEFVTGHFRPESAATNTLDLGGASNRVRTGYFGTNVSTPLITAIAGGDLTASVQGWDGTDHRKFVVKKSTASVSGGNLFEVQILDGTVKAAISDLGIYSGVASITGNVSIGYTNAYSICLTSGVGELNWASNLGNPGTIDLRVKRGGPNILSLENGLNAQAFHIYNTTDGGSNYERMHLGWVSNIFEFGGNTGAAGTGSERLIRYRMGTNGNTAANYISGAAVGSHGIYFHTGGANNTHLFTDNAITFGYWGGGTNYIVKAVAVGVGNLNFGARPLYLEAGVGTGTGAGSGTQDSRIYLRAAPAIASGTSVQTLENALIVGVPTTSSVFVAFGGLTSGKPALKQTGAALEVKTGDDGSYAEFNTGTHTATGSIYATQSLYAKQGTSASFAKSGGMLAGLPNVTAVGNVGAGEDDLMSFTIPANTFAANGDTIKFHAQFISGGVSAVTIKPYFAGTMINDGDNFTFDNTSKILIETTIVRLTSTTALISLAWNASGSDAVVGIQAGAILLNDPVLTGLNFTNSIIFKFTGTGTNNDDIIQRSLLGWYYPAN